MGSQKTLNGTQPLQHHLGEGRSHTVLSLVQFETRRSNNIYFKLNEYLMIQLICQPIIVQKLSFLLLLAPVTGVDASSLSPHEVLPWVQLVVRGATERCGVRGKGVGEGAALESISTKKTMRRSQTRRTLKKSVENLGEG